jgi:hypothetical protein
MEKEAIFVFLCEAMRKNCEATKLDEADPLPEVAFRVFEQRATRKKSPG